MPPFSEKTKLNHILDAAVTGQVEKVRKLLANGDFPPDSPELIISFRSACNNDNAELAALLLDYGIDVNIEIFPDWSALNGAIEEMSLEVIRLLIKKGANINRRNQYGQTPLHQAIDIEVQAAINCAIEPTGEIVKLLVDNGADVNAKTNEGETPLQWAKNLGNQPAQEILLNCQTSR